MTWYNIRLHGIILDDMVLY